MRSKERVLWDLVSRLLDTKGDALSRLSIHEGREGFDEVRKLYFAEGYCVELRRFEGDEDVSDVDEDGYVYTFCEPYDGFDTVGLEGAIEFLTGEL